MKFGVCLPNYGTTSSVEAIFSVAIESERLGYDSIWTTDHILMSRNSGTPYERIYDSVATLAYLAPHTRKVRLGISSLIIAMRNPAAVAKQLASIDAFSGGRMMLAVGVGWNEKEFDAVGSKFHDRGRRVDDSMRLLRSLWNGGTSFASRPLGIKFDDAVFDPKPAKALEVWIGGTSEAAMNRAINLGDAWHPNVFPLETFGKLVGKFRALPGGREKPVCVRIALDTSARETEYTGAQGEQRVRLTADMAANEKVVDQLGRLGVSYSVVVPSPEGKTPLEDQLRSLRAFADEFLY